MARLVGRRALQAGIVLVWMCLNMSDVLARRLGDGLLAKALGLVLFVLSGFVAALAMRAVERTVVRKRAHVERAP